MFNDWHLDNDSGIPAYEQIAYYLKNLISNGTLINGDRMLSQRDLCLHFEVSRPTISKAMELLERERLIIIESKRKATVHIDSNGTDYDLIDWNQYLKSSYHQENTGNYKKNNLYRANPNYINLFETYFGNDFSPMKPVIKAMKAVENDAEKIDHYSNFNIRGTLSLRQAVCSHLTKEGIHVAPSQVIICHSLQNAFLVLFKLLCNQSTACYVEKESVFLQNRMLPVNLNFIPLSVDKDGVVTDSLLKNLRTRKRGVLIVDPEFSMPSCITHSLVRRKELLRASYQWKLPVIESGAVRDCWHRNRPLPTFRALDPSQNVIHIFSLARPFMFAPVAAIIAPEVLIPGIIDIKLKNDVYTDVMLQAIFEKLLTENIYSDYMDSIRPGIISACEEADRMVHKYFSGLGTWTKPDHGVNFRIDFDFSIADCFECITRDGILLYPPEVFGSHASFIWFCYTGISLDKLDYALSRIAYHIKKCRKFR